MKYLALTLILIVLFFASGCKRQDAGSDKYDAAWNNLSAGNVIKTNLDADDYQYPCIGNHGLVLLADPYGFTQNMPTRASYRPDIYYSGWWKSNHYERANPFDIRGGYNVSGTLTPGSIDSFSQTLDVTKGDLTTKLGLNVNGVAINSVRTQFVTENGVLVISIEDHSASTFQVQISPQSGYVLKLTPGRNGFVASTTAMGQGHGASMSLVCSGDHVSVDTVRCIVSADAAPGRPACFYIAAGSEITDGADYIGKTYQKASDASGEGYANSKMTSESSYNAFWTRSSVSVPEDDMMRRYILSQYILKATLDNNPLPDGCLGPRKEGYCGSIGTECDQMFDWNAMLTANQPNIARVLPDWFENTADHARTLARTFYPNTRGVKWAWLSGYDGTECQEFQGKKVDWLAYNSAFAAYISLMHSKYTCDAQRLGRAKTILEDAVHYQLDACVKENGQWVNNGMIQGLGLRPLRGEITEQASLMWSLKKAVELGIGPSSWADEARKVYIPVRYDSVQGKNILIRYIEHTPSLGARLEGYYLYLYGTPWITLFLRAFDEHDPLMQPTYQAYIGDKDLTYTFGKGIAAANAALMGYGQEALSMLKSMPLHDGLYYAEYEDQPKTTIEVGAHGSLMLGIQHMLFDGQSEKTIRVFPALPREWENSGAGFSRLLANGAIEVSGRYSNSSVNVTLNNTSDENAIRTLLVRIPSTFTGISEKGGTKIEGIVDDRFAKMTVSIPSHSSKTLILTGKHGNGWYNADDSTAQYSAGWTRRLNHLNFYGSTCNGSNIGGSWCQYTFSGTAVRIIGQIGPDRGYAKVTIDSINYGCYNLYASAPETQKVLFEKFGLSQGKHTIKWEVTGKRIQVSQEAYVDIDKIEILTIQENRPVPWLTSDPGTWKPVPNEALSPKGGVRIAETGLFKPFMDRTISYLLSHSDMDDMLLQFRRTAGVNDPPGKLYGWEKDFPSHAAMFLMGAGNTLKWQEEPELHQRLNKLIDGIKECRNPEGGLKVPYVPFNNDAQGYSITLFMHGLESAGQAGNRDAWELMEAASREYRREIDVGTAANPDFCFRFNQNYFGVSACMTAYFSPVGVKDDITTALKHVHPGWMDLLAKRNPKGVYQIPISHPHSAETYGFVGFLDLYRATGDKRMLDAMIGAWELLHNNWELPGGTLALCEGDEYPPGSLHITPSCHTGESCAAMWWIRFNHQLHQLYPMKEQYMNTIEKGIYNVALANQYTDGTVCYHTHLESTKEYRDSYLSCCEVLGTYLFSSLPEYIYSVAEDGLYVNLYEASSIKWRNGDQQLGLTMNSEFPFNPHIRLRISTVQPISMKLRVRVPAWAGKDMPVIINGQQVAVGKPGNYVVLDRRWKDGDSIAFTLPVDFRVIAYTGADQIPGHKRYSIFYGPIEMAVVGQLEKVSLPDWESIKPWWEEKEKGPAWVSQAQMKMKPNCTYGLYIHHNPNRPWDWLEPEPDQPLNFKIKGYSDYYLKPYWQVVKDETFTCFPVIEPGESQESKLN